MKAIFQLLGQYKECTLPKIVLCDGFNDFKKRDEPLRIEKRKFDGSITGICGLLGYDSAAICRIAITYLEPNIEYISGLMI